MEPNGKILGIGLSRTGTTTLTNALELLGYKAIHAMTAHEIDAYEAATDTPIAARYRLLDIQYPGSKFILTVRDMESWLNSCEKWWYDLMDLTDTAVAIEYAFCRGAIYGIYDSFDREMYRQAYIRHVDGVHEYFRERPNDLLEINITAGEGFEKLCPFLGKPLLDMPLPQLNRASDLMMDLRGITLELYKKAARCYLGLDFDNAQDYLKRAIISDLALWSNRDWLLEWLAATARELAHDDPVGFINVFFDNLPPEAATMCPYKHLAIARYHVASAFIASEEHNKRIVRKHIIPAIVYSPSIIKNRGFVKIGLQSMF